MALRLSENSGKIARLRDSHLSEVRKEDGEGLGRTQEMLSDVRARHRLEFVGGHDQQKDQQKP
jgi:hypothetical protein